MKFRIEVAEDPQKHIFKVNFRFWILSCIAIGKIVFFQKAETFLHRVTLWHFFEIYNPNKNWLEISVFENSIIRWVYKVVKEALKRIWEYSLSVLLGDSKNSWSGSQVEEGEVQTLVNNWRNHPYTCWNKITTTTTTIFPSLYGVTCMLNLILYRLHMR